MAKSTKPVSEKDERESVADSVNDFDYDGNSSKFGGNAKSSVADTIRINGTSVTVRVPADIFGIRKNYSFPRILYALIIVSL